MSDEWQVSKGSGWIVVPGFGQLAPRRDNVTGGRQYFTWMFENDEVAAVTGAGNRQLLLPGAKGLPSFGVEGAQNLVKLDRRHDVSLR